MSRKSQSVIVSEKKEKKPTTKKVEEISYAWFEKSTDRIKKELGKQLLEMASQGLILSLEEFCMKKRVRHNTLLRWAQSDSQLHDEIEEAKLYIGVNRERGVITKVYDPKTLMYQWHFMPRFREHDVREDKRKIALANEGVTEGQIRIVTVNENIKVQEAE
jgi:hypothetical protein